MQEKQSKLGKRHLFIFAIFLGLFWLLIYWDVSHEYYQLTAKEALKETEITRKEKFGSLRGAVFYKSDHFISQGARFLSDDCNYKNWKENGLLLDLDDKPYIIRLYDLSLPYSVSKKPNNDTLTVKKDSCVLFFKLQPESRKEHFIKQLFFPNKDTLRK